MHFKRSKVFLLFCEFCACGRTLDFLKSVKIQLEIEFLINQALLKDLGSSNFFFNF